MTQPTPAEQLLNLANRAERGPLTGDEATRLRDGITEQAARIDTLEHVAKGNKRHVQLIVPELEAATARAEQAEAQLTAEQEVSRRLLAQRQEMAAERYAWQERGDKAERAVDHLTDRYRGAEAEVQQWRDTYGEHALRRTLARLHDAEAAVERVRKLAARWENALAPDRPYARSLRAALDDHQPTT